MRALSLTLWICCDMQMNACEGTSKRKTSQNFNEPSNESFWKGHLVSHKLARRKINTTVKKEFKIQIEQLGLGMLRHKTRVALNYYWLWGKKTLPSVLSKQHPESRVWNQLHEPGSTLGDHGYPMCGLVRPSMQSAHDMQGQLRFAILHVWPAVPETWFWSFPVTS